MYSFKTKEQTKKKRAIISKKQESQLRKGTRSLHLIGNENYQAKSVTCRSWKESEF